MQFTAETALLTDKFRVKVGVGSNHCPIGTRYDAEALCKQLTKDHELSNLAERVTFHSVGEQALTSPPTALQVEIVSASKHCS